MSETEETAEKLMTISLARARPTPRYRRTDRIVNVLKENVARNMKVDFSEVKISQKLNEEIWSMGKRSRRPRISVKLTKDAEGVVTAKLPDEKEEEEEKEEKGAKEAKAEAKVKEEPKAEAKPAKAEEAEEAEEAGEADETEEADSADDKEE